MLKRIKYLRYLLPLAFLFIPLASYGLEYDFSDWLHNLQTHLPAVVQLIIATAYVTGLWFFCLGLLKLKAYGHQTVFMATHANFTASLAYLVCGIALFYTPTMIDTSLFTFWNYGLSSVVAYPNEANTSLSSIMNPCIAIVRVIGYIAFVRGWIILVRIGQQGAAPGTIGKASTHIVGGMLAINIVGTWDVIQNTLQYAF